MSDDAPKMPDARKLPDADRSESSLHAAKSDADSLRYVPPATRRSMEAALRGEYGRPDHAHVGRHEQRQRQILGAHQMMLHQRTARLEATDPEEGFGKTDGYTPPLIDAADAGAPAENHSWRVILSVVSGVKKYAIDDGSGALAGTVLAVDGTPLDVSGVAATTYTADVFFWLKVVVTSASAATVTIETGTSSGDRPTDGDPFAEDPTFIFDLAIITAADDTVRQFLMQDVSLQGLPIIGGDAGQVWQRKADNTTGFDDVRMTA